MWGFTGNIFHKISGNFSTYVFQLANISERSYGGSAILGWCGSGLSKDDRGWTEEISPACVWSRFHDSEMWKPYLPPVVGEEVSWNGSLLLPLSVLAINNFIASHTIDRKNSLLDPPRVLLPCVLFAAHNGRGWVKRSEGGLCVTSSKGHCAASNTFISSSSWCLILLQAVWFIGPLPTSK